MYWEPSAVINAGGRADRLSRLADGVLGHILSFLPAAEAVRAAALSRRWRHVFAAVHAITFKEPKRPIRDDDGGGWSSDDPDSADEDDEDYFSSSSSSSGRYPTLAAAMPFADAVSAALHSRHRGPHAAPVPLRGLRVEFDGGGSDASAAAVDSWLHYAARNAAAGELHVDLRLGRRPICARAHTLRRGDVTRRPGYAPPEACHSSYAPPVSLLRCAALCSLRLASCRLDMPDAAAFLPALDTLHLTRIAGSGVAVQRLVSACLRLTDLTLEACCNLTEISVPGGVHLRKLAVRCCHDLAAMVAADLSELRSFEYSGPMPGPSIQTMNCPRQILSCTVNFCGEEAMDPAELGRLREFLLPFAGAVNMQIKSARLGASIGHGVLSSALELPCFHALRHLELTGMLPEDDVATVAGLGKMLERTPILETLSLFFMPEPEVSHYSCCNEDQLRTVHKLKYNQNAVLAVPEGNGVACLRERTREINLVHYQGGTAQRMLAKFLLCNARVVGEVYCEFARGPLFIQTKLMEEITGWVLNKSAKMVFF
ncbi:unnamed protein product [Urochloa decumbens]|uniref:F-box domain-containing protein n=1 Tax=Urochloa decumbens TaxID=240449 RepID=A0ABC9B2V0_9POAL